MQDTVPDQGRPGCMERRWLAALATVALAAGAVACGSDDGASNPAQAESNAASQADNDGEASKAPSGSDKQQIRQLLKDLQADYVEGDAVSYCSSLTAAGRKRVGNVGKPYRLGDSCEEFVSRTSAMAREAAIKQKPTVLLSVRVRGDRAVASVSDGGRPPQPLVFVKVGGEWRIPDPGIRDPLAPTKQTQSSRRGGPAQ